jgi:hypothetical protein
VLSVAVESDDWICFEPACDAENGCKLKPCKETHEPARIGVCDGVLRIVEVGAYEVEAAESKAVPLILQRE